MTIDGSALPGAAPEVSADNRPFWDAATEDRLVLPRCRSCGSFIWYPRSFCPVCHDTDVEWYEASGRGTVYSFTVAFRGPGPWSAHVPYVIAYVELEEGPRVLTNLVGIDPETVRIGDPVRAVFEPAGATKVLRFTAALP
jgi:uncharacterized OB-fold protein